MVKIVRYSHDRKQEWDTFVTNAKNTSFLVLRDYMDYHSDRFSDYSLMAYDDNCQLLTVLPANRSGDSVYSHQGLTYGGWIMPLLHFNVVVMLEVMDAAVEAMREDGVKELIYKPMPHIYHRYPAEEDLYALFRQNASIEVSNVSTTIDLTCPIHFNTGAKSSVSVARRNGVIVAENEDFGAYWRVLSELLHNRYGVSPVHTVEEIERLHKSFPQNIRLFTAKKDDCLLGGVVIYYVCDVAHSQYTAATAEGWRLRVIPAIYNYIIKEMCGDVRYLDFGISNEDAGHYLNEGLVLQKCGMGGRAIVYNTYKITL